MLFNSTNFITFFLPAFLISYFLVSRKFKSAVIFVYNILFIILCYYNSIIGFYALLFSLIVNYICISILYLIRKKLVLKKLVLFFSVTVNVLILVCFKSNFNGLVMPIGFSFYTFHNISVIVDYYRELSNNKEYKRISIFSYLSFILFFPKFLSGPIERYDKFKISGDNKPELISGVYTFSIGLALKCLLSDNLDLLVNQIYTFGFDSMSIAVAWVGVYCYTMKLYFDFAGYSLMAIGIAKTVGITLSENFDAPFTSSSVTEFWRRWHITLGRFFRDYIYIPLGGNCNNKNIIRQIFNLFFVWVITGLWHGFKPNYIIWAMISFVCIVFEKVFLLKTFKKYNSLGKTFTNIIMPIGFLIFSIENLSDLRIYMTRLFDFRSLSNMKDFVYIINQYWKIFMIGILFLTRFPKILSECIKKNKFIMLIISIILLYLSLKMISISSTDVFKYFTF